MKAGEKQVIAGEWKQLTFGDCAELVKKKIAPEDCPDAQYIGLEHIGESTLSLSSIGKAQDVISTKTLFKQGDILFDKLCPYFRKVVIAPFDGVCSTDIWVVRAKEGINQRFLFYWMASPEFIETATRASQGTKMPRAQWEFISSLIHPIPSLPEQRAIAHILGTLDDKIETNRKISRVLEEMARALFKAWFVEFEPVRAKIEGRWKHGQSLPGLPAHLYDLFPDRLVDSELGEIPEGWEVGTMGELVKLAYGKALKDTDRKPGRIPVYGSNGVIGWHSEPLTKGSGIIVGRKGNPGTVTWAATDFFCNRHYILCGSKK